MANARNRTWSVLQISTDGIDTQESIQVNKQYNSQVNQVQK